MNCAEVIDKLRAAGAVDTAERRDAEAEAHAAGCSDCRQALAALEALAAERARPIPAVAQGAAARAVERALQSQAARPAAWRGFWLGVAAGGAAAAGLAIGVAAWIGGSAESTPEAVPQIALAAGDSRDVSFALTSAEALANVEIHVVLTGAIELEGYGARELRWLTDLDRGVNELSLPVVAVGPSGGQLTVEVRHGERRRTFVVDVLGRG